MKVNLCFLFLRGGFRVKQNENLKHPICYWYAMIACPAILTNSCVSLHASFSTWWFHFFFEFSSLPGEMVQFDEHIISTGLISPPSFELDRTFSNFPDFFLRGSAAIDRKLTTMTGRMTLSLSFRIWVPNIFENVSTKHGSNDSFKMGWHMLTHWISMNVTVFSRSVAS